MKIPPKVALEVWKGNSNLKFHGILRTWAPKNRTSKVYTIRPAGSRIYRGSIRLCQHEALMLQQLAFPYKGPDSSSWSKFLWSAMM